MNGFESTDDSKAMEEIGLRLKDIRIKLGETQPALAAKLKCKRQTLSSWEQGLTTPDVKSLLRLKEIARTSESNPIEINLGEILGEYRVDAGATPLEYPIRLLQRIDLMGIRNVYANRRDALTSFLPFLESEQNSLNIVASSFLGVIRVAEARVAAALRRFHSLQPK